MLQLNNERGAAQPDVNAYILRDRVTSRHTLVRRLIPAGMYRREMVRRWVIGEAELDGITVGLAANFLQREQAFRLVHDAYVARGITVPTRSGMKFSPHHVLPGTTTFIAERAGRVLGTISLVEDSPIGLPMETVHAAEVAALRHAGRRFAEVSTLSVAQDVRGRGVSLLLYNALFRWARRHRLIEDLVIAVHPKMREFYCHGLLFECLGPTREYGTLNRALSIPLRIDLTTAPIRYRDTYDRGDMEIEIAERRTNLYRFFVEDVLDCVHLPRFEQIPFALSSPPLWSEGDVKSYLAECGVDMTSLTRQARRYLAAVYPGIESFASRASGAGDLRLLAS
ncbi:GNAT family N-acetyltransferase [Burkholderia cepacia]|uniref:GNAT family N-acetyltransferase n=1 Tax=Burkholderia cepacia TaxID=292 RepID=UPI000F5F7152|nr:GNAT family N-acetyltransferase [Burkholderia cepacia]